MNSKGLVRFALLLLLLLFFNHLFAQKLSEEDDAVVQRYAISAYNKEADSNVLLVKLNSAKSVLFKKIYANSIKRQISTNWFIIAKNNFPFVDSAFSNMHYTANFCWKLSSRLFTLHNSLSESKTFIFLVQTNDSSAFLQKINNSNGAATVTANYNDKIFQIKTSLVFVLHNILNDEHINFIDIKPTPPKEEMVINDYDNSVNAINLFFSKYLAINGDGLSVSVKENLFDTNDIDFKGRYQPTTNISAEITTHATTMATLIGGGGNSFYTGKGIGWGSRISSSDFANLLPDSKASYIQYGTSVQNHSYGTGIENFYGADANAFDQSLLDNPHLVYVFSAGNSGALSDSIGQYKNLTGFANITGSFKQAKNILIAGSVDSFYNIPLASSKGPAYDGRVKPELVAYGNDGSSGAAAITSGTAIVVQSAYAQMHHDSLPDNALVKAILINSADDVFNPGPDFYSGYGNVNTYKAVRDMSSGKYFSGVSKQDKIDSFQINVSNNINNLKITLVWNDEPAQANAFTALVNDLDVQLKSKTNNTLWLPWVLNSKPDSASLLALPVRKRDSLNVVEQITLSKPQEGEYTIYVKGYNIISAKQPFYVVYEIDTANQFYFITPSSQDHFMAGDKGIIRWDETYNNANGKLEYSLNKGVSWQTISNAVTLDNKFYNWKVPDTASLALMRMTIGSDVYTSDTFDFSQRISPEVIIDCSDSVLINWNKIQGIDQYKILQLGEKYLQDYTFTNDTSIIIKNSASPYIAVTSIFDDGRQSLNSYTFNFNAQGAGCYIDNFLADLTADNKANLHLSLGTTTGIDSVQLQQFIHNSWQTLTSITPITNTEIHYLYNGLTNGINTFRTVVFVYNNQIISNTASIYFFMNVDFIVKPNPLPQGQNLSILSSTLVTGTLVIYDVMGRKLLQQEITNTENSIHTASLARGIYFLVIYDNDNKQKVFKSKLIVD